MGHSLPHLAGSLVGEGDGQDLVRAHLAALDEVGQTVRQDAGLPGPGPRKHEQRTGRMEDGLSLRLVEVFT
jgi:hypothetical protein